MSEPEARRAVRRRGGGGPPALAEPGPAIPRATYRLQLNAGFTFRDATALVPYLAALGISHLYCSPYFRARSGSMHGYDVIDHNSFNPEIGERADFERFVAVLRTHGMGHIVDLVPNHVGILGSDNEWWMDVLENGEASAYAGFFDIDWSPPNPDRAHKVLVPVLGLVENMSSFACPHCGATTDIFRRGGGQRMSQQLAVPFLGSIPIDPDIVTSSDEGFPIVTSKPESRAAEAYRSIAKRLAETLDRASATPLRPFIWNWESDAGAPGWMESAISQQGARTAPVGFRKSDQRTLSILWQDGRKDNIDVRDLRLACLCAVCVHEMTGKKMLDPGTVRSDVSPRSINSVGNYAINVTFNDGHSSGIYSFEHLRGLGEASRGKASFDV